MGRYAQLVVGPAGSGKSTYCSQVQAHCASVGRTVHVVNLDPAADRFEYSVSGDVRELVSLEDVMEELKLGPNGALLCCMEYLEEHMEWLNDVLSSFGEDDYVLFDCPGQIELYSHVTVFNTFSETLKQQGWSMCVVYLLDSQFIIDAPKYISGCLAALSSMLQMELPHVNVLSKVDLLREKKTTLEEFLTPDMAVVSDSLSSTLGPRYRRLHELISSLLDTYSLVSFVPLDVSDEESVAQVLMVADNAIQYGEDADVRTGGD